MLTIDLDKPVVIYDDIKEMIVDRYSDFTIGVMIDAQIGSSISDFDKLFNRVVEFMDAGKHKDAMQVLLNARTGIHLAQQKMSPSTYAFASLVSSIGGVRIKDYSEASLTKIIKELNSLGLTQAKLEETLEEVKKKSSMI